MLTLLRNIRGDESAVAFVEFALALPVVLVLALGGLETTNLAMTHLRVSQVAVTTADNAARVVVQMDESDINEIFAGATLVGEAIDIKRNGRIILSSVQPNSKTGSDAGQWVRWQRCFGSLNVGPRYAKQGDGATNNSLAAGMGSGTHRISAQPGTAIMFVEVSYDYQPLFARRFLGSQTIRYETAFSVRERTELGITNSQSLPLNNC